MFWKPLSGGVVRSSPLWAGVGDEGSAELGRLEAAPDAVHALATNARRAMSLERRRDGEEPSIEGQETIKGRKLRGERELRAGVARHDDGGRPRLWVAGQQPMPRATAGSRTRRSRRSP